jgi:hypothetical protein
MKTHRTSGVRGLVITAAPESVAQASSIQREAD